MQTFLPYADFSTSATNLDDVRLRKQILEVAQILNALAGGKGYAQHPVTLAWQGREGALSLYGCVVLEEYRRRGGRGYVDYESLLEHSGGQEMPSWIGCEVFHRGHRGHLFRKDPQRYAAFSQDAEAPLLYPCAGRFVERVVEGQFRPFPSPNEGRTYRSVKSACGI